MSNHKHFGLMASRLQIEGDESVLCRVTHSNLKSFNADVRFSLQVCVYKMLDFYVYGMVNSNLINSFVVLLVSLLLKL